MRGQLQWTSPILRHALRLSAATAVGTAVARFGGVGHGYWIALTVLMVLRPETAHTYTRCAGRVAAVAAGVVVASGLATLWHPTGLAAAALAMVFLGLTYVVVGFGFLALSASLAAALVFIIDIAATEAAGFDERLIATAIGGTLAVVAHVVLPDDAMVRLRQRAGELLKTEIDYAATVINGFVHELDHPADKLSAAWQRAFRARAAFEAASGATRVDSRDLRRWLRSYRNALNAVTSSCTVLETSLPAHPSAALGREFVTAVDDYIVVLRGDPPSPGHAVDRRHRGVGHDESAGTGCGGATHNRRRRGPRSGCRGCDDHAQRVRNRHRHPSGRDVLIAAGCVGPSRNSARSKSPAV